jgi:hypothetical protein
VLFVYVQDNQGYWVDQVLMEATQDITPDRLAAISWEVPGAGRTSTSVGAFIGAAKKHDIDLVEIERISKTGIIPAKWASYPVVVGATGNY